MEKVYIDTPHNFQEIAEYVITDAEDIEKNIIMADKCYFYDTCSFRNHMMVSECRLIFDYIKLTSGIVIITRTILMELCSNDGCLWREHIEYIKNMYQAGIKICLIYEEDIFGSLHVFCADIKEINKWLSFAVRCAKNKVGKIEEIVEHDSVLKQALFAGMECKDSSLARRLFTQLRSSKASQDNMGEELLAVCVHWLSRMRHHTEYKYCIFTDDKKAIPTLGKVIRNVKEYSGCNSIAVCTTVKLCALLRKSEIVENEAQIVNILSSGNCYGDNLKVYCSAEFELSPDEKTMSIQEYARVVIDGRIKVYY